MSGTERKTETYIVTERAGDWVAGRRVKHGQPLELTESEAYHERNAGTIIRKPPPAPPAAAPPSAPADAPALVRPARGRRRRGEG